MAEQQSWQSWLFDNKNGTSMKDKKPKLDPKDLAYKKNAVAIGAGDLSSIQEAERAKAVGGDPMGFLKKAGSLSGVAKPEDVELLNNRQAQKTIADPKRKPDMVDGFMGLLNGMFGQ